MRCSIADNTWPSASTICAIEEICPLKCKKSTPMLKEHRLFSWGCLHTISLNKELELGAIKPELVPRCVHKPDETWDGKREWIEKYNIEQLEAGSGDLTNKYFDVCTDALEA